MTIPQPSTPIRQGSDDSSKQVYERLDVYIQPLVKDRSHEAPEAALPQYTHHKPHIHHNYPQHQQYVQVPSPSSGASSTDPATGSNPKTSENKKSGRSRPSWLVSILVAVLAAAIAATITGVTVWKATESKGSSPSCPTVGGGGGGGGSGGDGGSNSCPPVADSNVGGGDGKAIRPSSGLAAIGWRIRDESFIQLVYQDPDSNLMTSWFSSLWSNWTAPKTVQLEESGHKAMAGTPMAISTLFRNPGVGGPYEAQNQMNYLSPAGTVLGYNFRLTWPLGLPDSIIGENWSGATYSNLASLWPYNYFQADSAIMQVYGASENKTELKGLSNAAKGTPLLALPVSPTHNKEEVRLFYRNMDGKLALFERDSRGSITSNTGALSVDIPADARLGGFSTARDPTGPGINTYVLWQDGLQKENGGVRIISQADGGNEWKGPVSDPVFSRADIDTRIACINEGMGAIIPGSGQGNIRLSNNRELNRCYFQADGGKLKQSTRISYPYSTASVRNTLDIVDIVMVPAIGGLQLGEIIAHGHKVDGHATLERLVALLNEPRHHDRDRARVGGQVAPADGPTTGRRAGQDGNAVGALGHAQKVGLAVVAEREDVLAVGDVPVLLHDRRQRERAGDVELQRLLVGVGPVDVEGGVLGLVPAPGLDARGVETRRHAPQAQDPSVVDGVLRVHLAQVAKHGEEEALARDDGRAAWHPVDEGRGSGQPKDGGGDYGGGEAHLEYWLVVLD
ncbi:hypothetical protein PspLS_04298 [Pyricularia sp. CBS 133598]|nr:hypothetical protein PspLS_04298 [Pyricularia sp. CBS 133598]